MSKERLNPGSLCDIALMDTVFMNPWSFPKLTGAAAPPLIIHWRKVKTLTPHDSIGCSVS